MAMTRQADLQLPDELVMFAFEQNVKQAGLVLIRHLQQEENLPQIDQLTPFQESVMEATTPGIIRRLHSRLQRIEHARNQETRATRRVEKYPTFSALSNDL